MSKSIYKYQFNNGDVVTSYLESAELMTRMNRLDRLRVLTEGYEEGEGLSICNKALRAYNKTEGFTGIIRLSFSEKDWLCYLLENPYLSDEDIDCIKYYCNI